MILVSEAGSIFISGLNDATTWPVTASIEIQARAAMAGIGMVEISATCTGPEVVGVIVPAAGAAAVSLVVAFAGADLPRWAFWAWAGTPIAEKIATRRASKPEATILSTRVAAGRLVEVAGAAVIFNPFKSRL